jgi:nucleotidyltransferase AbiEii toxin of type IV toxin-antitoxin system
VNRDPPRDLAASVRQRLLNLARAQSEDFQRLLTRYAQERLLFRLSRSEHRDRFILKGALLFVVWSSDPYRPTRDLDLLGRGHPSAATLIETFQTLCTLPVEADGLVFLRESVQAVPIREEMEYGGTRITLIVRLERARIPLQVDVGMGDAITPAPVLVEFPVLLDFPVPILRAYPRATVVAEKLQALVALGMDNSRMKDFGDLWVLCERFPFEGVTLAAAVGATFTRRRTPLPSEPPVALTAVFSTDTAKRRQWQAFVSRSLLSSRLPDLPELIACLGTFLLPVLDSVREGKVFAATWPPGGPWNKG